MEPKDRDYVNVKATPHLVNNEKIFFSALITKYNEFGFRQDRVLVVTINAVYNLKRNAIQRRIPLERLEALSLSTTSSEFVVHVKDEYDYRFLSYDKRDELVETILYVVCGERKLSAGFPIYYVPLMNLNEVMTTQSNLKTKHFVRPNKEHLKIMNLEKFKDIEQNEQKRKTELRKNTKTLYSSKKDVPDMSIDDFELLKLLGKGAFGKVFLVQKKDDEKMYAIKVLKKTSIIELNQLEHTKAEKMILSHVNHQFLVSLVYAFQTPEKLYFVMEFMKGGELYQHLLKLDRFTEHQAKFYAACITLALGHLHNNDYIYRDLKLENILLDDQGYAKLTDFGLAKFVKSDEKALTFCGTPEYLSPELLLGHGHNRPADWWSLGVLIYEMLYGVPPFYSSNVQNMYKKIVREQVVFRPEVNVSDLGKDLINKLLLKDQGVRLGSQADSLEVLSHPWFADLDWTKILGRQLEAPFKPKVDGDEWMKNFDKEFINEKARDTNAKVDLDVLKNFQKEFDELTGTTE